MKRERICKICGKSLPEDWDEDECELCLEEEEMNNLASNMLWSSLSPNIDDLCGKK